MRDAGQDTVGIPLRAALDQAVGLVAPGEGHGAIKHGPVKPILLHIAQEIACRDRRAFGFQRDGDLTHGGLQHYLGGREFLFWYGFRSLLRGEREGDKDIKDQGGEGESFQHDCHPATGSMAYQ